MSDNDSPPKRIVKVEEFIDFLVEKKVQSVCLSCGHEKAFISSDADPAFAAQTKMPITEFDPINLSIKRESANVILALSIICNNCGFIRSYAAHNVYDWLSNREKSQPEPL